jgi:DNA-binding MarR family transcriptional regulator
MLADNHDLANVGPLGELLSIRLRRVDLLLSSAFARPGLRTELIVCLAVVASRPGVSQNELARIVRSDASMIVGFVNQLEGMEWMVRRPSETDRRRHALFATDKGEQELARMTAEIRQAEGELLAQVEPEEVAFLRHLLDKIHASCTRAMQAK